MQSVLTPRDLARAIGSSESSLRRWIDAGLIKTFRTRGGHRRIPIEEGMRFIRSSGSAVIRPDLLGLSRPDVPLGDDHAIADSFFTSLRDGGDAAAMSLIMSLHMAGRSVTSIFDGPMRSAMHRVGDLWRHSQKGILQEHRATNTCMRILHQLRQTLAPIDPNAPLALGGAPEGDVYSMPSAMADIVLTDAGYRTVNYGARTPADLLADSAEEHHADLVWLSISVEIPKEQLRAQLHRLARRLLDGNRMFVIGGRHAHDLNMQAFQNVVVASSMSELAAVGKGVFTARQSQRKPEEPRVGPAVHGDSPT